MNAGRRLQSSPYWLIIRSETYGVEVLTIEYPGPAGFHEVQEVLPLFSSREDAEEFLGLFHGQRPQRTPREAGKSRRLRVEIYSRCFAALSRVLRELSWIHGRSKSITGWWPNS